MRVIQLKPMDMLKIYSNVNGNGFGALSHHMFPLSSEIPAMQLSNSY